MLTRNQQIYHERVVEKRTLQSIALKYGVSRERVRQIVAKEEGQKALEKTFPEVPVYVRDIFWTTRVYNVLYNEDLTPLFLQEFIEYLGVNDIRRAPNLGKVGLTEIKTKLAKHGYELPDGY